MANTLEDAIAGCILGTAVGDAVGLPCEGISRPRQQKLFPAIKGPNLFLGRGMVSDDTEHRC
ncbi:MAG TPA: ADP-ribosylglycohydrolase family protein [Abditibacteriaceae bacterium]|jgi:ADP-ribosylglycohydrolase